MSNKISACLIVYNEEKLIGRCLESISKVVDEIIVVHDGECSDKTLVIANAYNAKIFVRPRRGAMEYHLPFCLDQASNDWILRIDADEYFDLPTAMKLHSFTNDNEVSAYEFTWPLWNGVGFVTKNWPKKICLFKKSRISFLSIVHYIPEIKGRIKALSEILYHQPGYYNITWSIFRHKWLKWAKIQANVYSGKFSDVLKYNYPATDWPTKIKLRKRFPLLLIPFEFFVTVFKNLKDGAYKEGFYGYKFSIFYGFYRVMLNLYLFFNKHVKTKEIIINLFYFFRGQRFYLRSHNIVCHKHKFIYYYIPKVACSSLKKFALDMIGLQLDKKCGIVDEAVHYVNFPSIKNSELNKYSDYFKFGFIRNPYDRLLSCYLNKIKAQSDYNEAPFVNGVFAGFLKYGKFRAGMSFEEFVKVVYDIPDKQAEDHFKSQYLFVTDKQGKLLLDFVGRFENIKNDFDYILEKLNIKYELFHYKKSASSNPAVYFNENINKLIRERYSRDFELFKY